MKQFFKKHGLILLAFFVPIAFIIVITLSVFLPSRMVSTEYNFVYATCVNDNSIPREQRCNAIMQKSFALTEGMLSASTTPDNLQKHTFRFFLHDTELNESKEITYDDAVTYAYHDLMTSPDDVTVSGMYEGRSDLTGLFGGSRSYDFFLLHKNRRKKLNLILTNVRYYNNQNFKFIGWVLPAGN